MELTQKQVIHQRDSLCTSVCFPASSIATTADKISGIERATGTGDAAQRQPLMVTIAFGLREMPSLYPID
jgi:hypothetical protein